MTKLDFTVNFIGELTSVESLRSLIHLKEMYAARSNSRLIYFHAVFIFLATYMLDMQMLTVTCIIIFDIKKYMIV